MHFATGIHKGGLISRTTSQHEGVPSGWRHTPGQHQPQFTIDTLISATLNCAIRVLNPFP
jgi:hypothetical protein